MSFDEKAFREQQERLMAENVALRETVTRLNRRCQEAESAANVKVEEIRKQGGSFGRALAAWSAGDQRRRAENAERLNGELRETLAWIKANPHGHGLGACPICVAIDRLLTERPQHKCADCGHDDTPLGTCADKFTGDWAALHCRKCCKNPTEFKLLR